MIHIIAIKNLKDFIHTHPEFKNCLEAWVSMVESCEWEKPQDIVTEFGAKAIDLLGKKDTKRATTSSNRVVFDIKGNHLRVIAKYQFHRKLKEGRIYLKWIGTHKEYDQLCKKSLQFEIDMFKRKES